MPLPTPQNCRFHAEENGFTFTVELNGKDWACFITTEAVQRLYPNNHDNARAVSSSALIAKKIAERLSVGDDFEPIYLTSTMFDDKGR